MTLENGVNLPMQKPYFGQKTKEDVAAFLKPLIDYANSQDSILNKNIKYVRWSTDPEKPYTLEVKTIGLQPLVMFAKLKQSKTYLSETLYRLEDTVKILEFNHTFKRTQRGEKPWIFSISLWSRSTEENLKHIQNWKKEAVPKDARQPVRLPSSDNNRDIAPESHVLQESPIELDSPDYIERQPLESNLARAILKPGSLVRLKGPQQIGKTSLVERLLLRTWKEQPGKYRTVVLSFNLAELSDTTRLLKWLCAAVSRELNLPNQVATEWDDTFSSNQSATTYFEDRILKAIQQPLILVLDNIDVVFGRPELRESFCRLLRHWNDLTKGINHRAATWRQLRLVLVHATDKYGSLDINCSPLAGIGCVFALSEFSEAEIDELATRYHLSDINIQEVKRYLGGHPSLVRDAFNYLEAHQASLEQLWKIAPTEKSPFGHHLRHHLDILQQNPEVGLAFKEVLASEEPVRVSSSETFKLQSMGLVKIDGDLCSPLCELYREYFSLRLQEKSRAWATLVNLLQLKIS